MSEKNVWVVEAFNVEMQFEERVFSHAFSSKEEAQAIAAMGRDVMPKHYVWLVDFVPLDNFEYAKHLVEQLAADWDEDNQEGA